jgi:hypothetical protein
VPRSWAAALLVLSGCGDASSKLDAQTACTLSSDFVAQVLSVLDHLGGFGGSPSAADTATTLEITRATCTDFDQVRREGTATITLTLDYTIQNKPVDQPVSYACALVLADDGWRVATCR